MKNYLVFAAAIAVAVCTWFYLPIVGADRSFEEIASSNKLLDASLDYANSVTGTGLGSMTGAPAAWTVIALSKDYKNDPLEMGILEDFATKDSLIELRKNSEVRTMVEGDPLLSKGGPLDGIGWFPTVAVINSQGQLLYKSSGGYACHVAEDIESEGINAKIAKPLYADNKDYDIANAVACPKGCKCNPCKCGSNCKCADLDMAGDGIRKRCPSCPFHPKPRPEPREDPAPETPQIPDTPHIPDTPKGESENDPFIPLAAAAGCVAGLVAYFRQSS